MTQVLSIRMPASKVAALDRKAADSGLDRSKYILKLVEQDLSAPASKNKRRFASARLLGKFRSTGSTNTAARNALKAHAKKDR